MRLLHYLNKPEYAFRPSQVLRRIFGTTTTSVHLPWGLPLRVRPADAIGRALLTTGVYDLALSEAAWRLVDAGETAVDVGGHVGYVTSILARRCGRGGMVHTFEPHPENFAETSANVAAWSGRPELAEIRVHQLALGAVAGEACLAEPDGFEGNRGTASLVAGAESNPAVPLGVGRQWRVPVARLDAVLGDKVTVGVMKVDVEGHELGVFQGAEALLAGGRIRDILFEEHQPYPTPATSLLEKHGYTVFGLVKSFWGPVLGPPEIVRDVAAWIAPNLLGTRDPDRARARLKKFGWQCL